MNSVEGYKQRVIRISKYTAVLLAIFAIGLLTPFFKIFLGLMLGTVVSLINMLFTAWKVNAICDVAEKSSSNKKQKRATSGMFSRMAMAILAVVVVMKYPEYFNLYSTVAGLVIVQIISVVDGVKNKF